MFGLNDENSSNIQSVHEDPFNKIHFYYYVPGVLINPYSTIDNSSELSNAIENMNTQCEATNSYTVKFTVEFKTDYFKTKEYDKFLTWSSSINNAADRLKFRKALNAFSGAYFNAENEKNIEILNSIKFNEIETSEYAPFVTIQVNAGDITESFLVSLANNEKICNICIDYNYKISDEATSSTWNNMLKSIEAYSTVDSGLLKGNGVRIGVLEDEGVCDTSFRYLSDKSITLDPNFSSLTSTHATRVTSVLALMAPNAEFYVSVISGHYPLDWLINNNCDVINTSFGRNLARGTDGSYNAPTYNISVDGYYDFIIDTYYITIVNSAGNKNTNSNSTAYNPDSYVTSPGLATDIITVGGLDKTGIGSITLEHHSGACYKTVENSPKPEISAIYNFYLPNMTELTGTSYCAPQVTACAALFIEQNPYIVNPSMIKSSIISCANKTRNFTNDFYYFNDKVGAGSLDFYEMRNIDVTQQYTIHHVHQVNNSPLTDVRTITVNLSRGDILQADFSWIGYTEEISGTFLYNHEFTDYDLKLYDPAGNLATISAFGAKSTSEFIRYTAESSGAYTLIIHQYSSMPTNITWDNGSLIYCIK